MSSEGAHVERPAVPDVQAEGRHHPPGGPSNTRDLRLLLRKVQDDVRNPLSGAEAQGVSALVKELKALRGGRSLECIASRAEMKRQQLHNIESGETRNPGILTVGRIAEALGYKLVLAPLDEADETL